MTDKKKCIVCNKEKKLSDFALKGRSPRCKLCKTTADKKKKKPGNEYFGI